jgi:hypothetical protein
MPARGVVGVPEWPLQPDLRYHKGRSPSEKQESVESEEIGFFRIKADALLHYSAQLNIISA